MMQDSLGYLLNTSARLIKRNLEARLKKFDLTTSQWAMLNLLSTEKDLTQAEIAEKSYSDRATTGGIIERLIEKGLIKKDFHKKDRRSYIVSLTEQGIQLNEEIKSLGRMSNEKATQGLSNTEIDTLIKYLKVIIDNL